MQQPLNSQRCLVSVKRNISAISKLSKNGCKFSQFWGNSRPKNFKKNLRISFKELPKTTPHLYPQSKLALTHAKSNKKRFQSKNPLNCEKIFLIKAKDISLSRNLQIYLVSGSSNQSFLMERIFLQVLDEWKTNQFHFNSVKEKINFECDSDGKFS